MRHWPYNLRHRLVLFCFCTRTIRTPSEVRDLYNIRNSTMSLTTLVLSFFISQICFWDHKYVFHLGKVFYHLVEVIFHLFASMFLTLCPNLSNFHMSSHVPREISHMASLVYYKIWDFHIFVLYCTVFSSSS